MVTLTESYALSRSLHRRHGRTYYLATRLLPAWKRRHVHALYGFARYADDIVDSTVASAQADRAAQLVQWSQRFLDGLAGCAAPIDDPVLPAVLHTVKTFDLDERDFKVFLRSMAMDLTVTQYPTYDDLLDYMEGSAASIGTMMLPILLAPARGQTPSRGAAREPARQLGFAFQLTNFIRDVAEDLDRGRIYLPLADLDRFEVTPADLAAARAAGRATPAIKALIRYEIDRARGHYALAAPGIPMLAPSSRPSIRAALRLYAAILEEIAGQDHDVFVRRAVVPGRRRLRLAAGALIPAPPRAGRPDPRPAAPI